MNLNQFTKYLAPRLWTRKVVNLNVRVLRRYKINHSIFWKGVNTNEDSAIGR